MPQKRDVKRWLCRPASDGSVCLSTTANTAAGVGTACRCIGIVGTRGACAAGGPLNAAAHNKQAGMNGEWQSGRAARSVRSLKLQRKSAAHASRPARRWPSRWPSRRWPEADPNIPLRATSCLCVRRPFQQHERSPNIYKRSRSASSRQRKQAWLTPARAPARAPMRGPQRRCRPPTPPNPRAPRRCTCASRNGRNRAT